MLIKQYEFFKGLGFEKHDFEYGDNKINCYKGIDGGFYRVDHFRNSYVIEYAENEEEAKLNRFEDVDLYNDSLPKDNIINLIQSDLRKFVTE